MRITEQQAKEKVTKAGKQLPPKGETMETGIPGEIIYHGRDGVFYCVQFPVTPEQVEIFERENAEFIMTVPKIDPNKLLERIKARKK